MGTQKQTLNASEIRNAATIIHSLNHTIRSQMLTIMEENPGITVTELYIKLRIDQSVASQHLAILRRTGIVIASRDGKQRRYNVNFPMLEQIEKVLKQLCECPASL